jgi:GxxExxY protein
MEDDTKLNDMAGIIIDAAQEIHRVLGPGLPESTYEICLAYEIAERGLRVETHKPLPVTYKSVHLDEGCQLDVLVEDMIIVEVTSVDALRPIHTAQLLSFLKLANLQVGLLINFNTEILNNGIRRIVNHSADNA